MTTDDYAIAIYHNMTIVFDDGGDPWLTQNQIGELLGISKQAVSDMLNVAAKNGDLEPDSVVNLRLIAGDGKSYNVKHYDFDAVLLVGYRSKAHSERTRAFRQWVSNIIKSHLRETLTKNENLRVALSHEQREKHEAQWAREVAERSLNDHLLVELSNRYPEEFED